MSIDSTIRSRTDGYALVEVMLACALLVTIAVGVAQVMSMAMHATRAARVRTVAAVLAGQKMEQMRSLAWRLDAVGSPPVWQAVSDTNTDLSADPPGDGGVGLSLSPVDTLEANLPPYVDYLDNSGRWVGSGSSPPPGAAYTRRWSIRPLESDPDHTVVLHVLVRPAHLAVGAPRTVGARADETLLVCLKTRRAQ